jgi:hypothetical protein
MLFLYIQHVTVAKGANSFYDTCHRQNRCLFAAAVAADRCTRMRNHEMTQTEEMGKGETEMSLQKGKINIEGRDK